MCVSFYQSGNLWLDISGKYLLVFGAFLVVHRALSISQSYKFVNTPVEYEFQKPAVHFETKNPAHGGANL